MPPTCKFFSIPTPPSTIKAPVSLVVDCVVLVKFVCPVTPNVLEIFVAPVTPNVLEIVVAPVTPNVTPTVAAPCTVNDSEIRVVPVTSRVYAGELLLIPIFEYL